MSPEFVNSEDLFCLHKTEPVFGRPFVKRFPYAIGRCLSVLPCLSVYLSVCPVCLWRWCIVANKGAQLPNFRPMSGVAGWIKMPLGAGDIVLDGDPIPPKGAQLWPNGCLDQDATWYEGRPLPRPHFVTWGPSSPSPKKGHSSLLIFSPHLLWPNGWMDQDAAWYRGRPSRHCVRWGSSSP